MTSRPATAQDPQSAGRVILVVGMHRSGTSAVASALSQLGLGLPASDDLLGPRRGNERGHFESLALIAENDDILRRLGGAWDDPPPVPSDPASCEELSPVLGRARAAFAKAFADRGRPACWKDPRTSLLLGLWRQVIDRPLAAVLCLRHPLQAARSLEERDGISLPFGLALWERYLRSAVAGLSGLSVFVSGYSDALADPRTWRAEMSEWLDRLDVARVEDSNGVGSAPPFEATLRHLHDGDEPGGAGPGGAGPGGAGGLLLAQQQELYDELCALRGTHACFAFEPRSRESPWTTFLLEQHRDTTTMWRGMEWLSQELSGHFLSLPPSEPGKPVGDAPPYALNATENEERYHAWLKARGETVFTRPGTPEELVAEREATTGKSPVGPRSARRYPIARYPVPSLRIGEGTGAVGLQREGEGGSEGGSDRSGTPRRPERPLFSVIVPCYRTPLDLLDRCVASVLAQSYSGWELCVCDDASDDALLAERLSFFAASDPRICITTRSGNGGISAATNDALALGTGRYAVFLDHDDELAPSALEHLAKCVADRPEADLIYSDEDKIDGDGRRHMPSFKPDWSPDLLLSNAYMCHVLVVRRDLVMELGGLSSELDGAQDYDLMLRVTEVTSAIVHIPEILYHWRTSPGSASGDASAKPWAFEAGRRALQDAARRRGIDATVVQHPRVPGSYHLKRKPRSNYLVSAVIPFRDEPALTAACYRSFIEAPGYDNFELLLVNNDSVLPETRALLEDLARDHRVRLLEAPGPFDWVAINNEAARKARGDLLLFLNNDVVARSKGWLAAMVAQAERPEVGAVGSRLVYPDGTIQHAGVVVGVGWGATHVQQGLGADRPGYLSLTTVTRNFSAVTGACLMSRRSVFEEVGGFEAKLPIAFNDIDYCLRLRQLGLLVVYTPLAEMIHHESKSRGNSDDVTEAPFFRKRWRSLILAGDPYYNRHLGRFDNGCQLPNEGDEERWEIFLSMLGESSTS